MYGALTASLKREGTATRRPGGKSFPAEATAGGKIQERTILGFSRKSGEAS